MKKFTQLFIFLITTTLFGQQKEYKIFNSEVNSRYAELGINFLDSETVFFASSKKIENDKAFSSNRRAKNRNLFLEFYFGKLTDSSDILQTNRLSSDVFATFNETDLALSPDRKTIYFCRDSNYDNQPKDSKLPEKPINLFKADIDADFNITNILPVSFNSETYSIRNPFINKDGTKLFFTSNMPGGYGNYDIYVSNILENGSLSSPKNLGDNINTFKDDLYPSVANNNTLYFASYGHKGKGNLDIFKSEFINGKYTKVENLPAPINSISDDFGYVMHPNNDSGFFISNRKKGKGDVDIYGFKLIDIEIECIQLVTGILLNNTINKPIANASLTIYTNDKAVDSLITAKDGSYKFKLKCNEAYKVTAQKEHFISNEITFDTDETLDAEIVKNIELIAVPCVQQLNGIVTNARTNELLENITLKLFQNGEIISTKTTRNDALYNFELACNNEYKIIADKDGFFPSEIKIKTNANYDEELTTDIALKPLPCIQVVSGEVSNKLTGETLINTALKIYKNDKLVTSEILRSRSNFRIELECESVYKIIAEKKGFLDAEIKLNTNKQLDLKLIENIELSPIECNQLITGTILNKQTNEPLSFTTVKLYKNKQLIDSQLIENNNDFSFNIECNENYKIIAEKDGFVTAELPIKTNSKNDHNFNQKIALVPLPCNQIVSGVVTNLKTNEPLLNSTLKLTVNGTTFKTINTDSNSAFSFNLKCENTYTIIAQKEGFLDSEITLNTNKQADLKFTNNIDLTPIECNQLITGTILNKQTNEPLNNTTVKLFKNNQLTDSQLIENNKNYIFKVDCNENYKIIVEKNGFETAELPIRTDSKNDHNLSQKIALVPLPCNQVVSGVVTNTKTGELLVNTTLKLTINGTTIKTVKTDRNSAFNFNLKCENTYTIIAQKDGFLDSEITINTDKQADLQFTNNIELTPIECNQLITGIILNKQTNEPLSSTTVKLFKNQQLIDSQLIENNKNYNFKVDCNENYKIIAEKDGFETAELQIRTDSRNDYSHIKKIFLIPIVCKQLFTGVIADESTGNELNNLQISLFENDVLKETINLKTLEFKFDLECNASYKLLVEKSNYSNAEITFSTDNINNFKIEKIIKLVPNACLQIVNGLILDKETNLPIASANITVFTNNTKIKEVLADENGNFNLELGCTFNFDLFVNAPGYQPYSFIINATQNYEEITSKTVYLNSQEEFEIVRNKKMVKINPINFDLNKAEITPQAAIELDKVVAILQNYPTIKIETKSHTDSRAPDSYNLELSNRRASSTISYIISKGIDSARIYGKGYGETELVNRCSNGVKCTEKEHQLNRRTEFIVIEE
ncbi:OmpA family protein [Lutibacter sp.]|uniref:OmpA family protein n=1 Tax=Lutibacter sp. TaxID=1925666 RepID=UPI0034A0416F